MRFPTGTTHVFCYAYYVTPPPTSGMIIIRKQVDVDAPQSYTQDFRFVSNITYNASGDFLLAVNNNAPASQPLSARRPHRACAVGSNRGRAGRLATAVTRVHQRERHQFDEHRRREGGDPARRVRHRHVHLHRRA